MKQKKIKKTKDNSYHVTSCIVKSIELRNFQNMETIYIKLRFFQRLGQN